jgi:elongation factor 1-beta
LFYLLKFNTNTFRFTPSAADLVVLAAVGKADLSAYENVQRWSRHISSYSSAEQAKFPGEKKAISQYGPKAAAAAPAAAAEAKEDEDDIDLFGSDDDEVDEEAEKLKQQRLEEYKAKKANKPKVIAKSSVVLDVKPWDDETDMKALEEGVRGITMDGLLWGASKLVAVGFGIKKLQIGCVIEDDKVSTDELIEDHIMALEDYVQSVDIAAFQKI